jgi:hypothetical protein
MASRPIIAPYSVISNGNMVGNLTSIVTVIQTNSLLSYTYKWLGTSPVGSVVVEASNDYSQNSDGSVNNIGSWNVLPLSSPTTITGNADNGLIDIDAAGFYAVRTRYVSSSGTGVLNVTISGKVS